MNIFEKRDTIQPYEYPNLIRYANAIHESFWTPEHFTYDRDINDFIVKLDDKEKDIVKKAMLAIGVIENKVKTFWARIDMRMPKTEIAIVGHTFAGNEVIHQITYEKLLSLLGLEKDFENVVNIPCMQGRSEYLSKYLQGVYSKSNKEFTKSLVLFTLLVENASLFSQFLIVSSFKKYKNLMSNFNSVISATAREECYIKGTEVLTPSGWRDILTMNIGDLVYQWDNGKLEIVETSQVTKKYHNGFVVKFSKKGHNCIVTPNHNMVSFVNGKRVNELAKDYKINNTNKYIADSFPYFKDFGRKLSFLERLYIAIQADGNKTYWFNKNGDKLERGKYNGYNYQISLKKERKIERLQWILSNIEIKHSVHKDARGYTVFKIHIEDNKNCKDFSWINFNSVDKSWALDFCEELSEWDGFKIEGSKDCKIAYSSTNKECIDIAQHIGIIAGYRTTISVREDKRKESYKDCYKLNFSNSNGFKRSHSLSKDFFEYKGEVGCITVPSGVIITRYNNKTFISGNCVHAKFGEDLINIIREENPDWFDTDMENKIRRNVRKALEAEVGVLDWIFEKGELDFLPKKSIVEYLKSRFNKSLNQIGYENEFEIDEYLLTPTEFLEVQLTATSSFDFFNEKSTDYSQNTAFDEENIWEEQVD
jgi:ribonucleotide reductase beta subunit family protein with ferritin-like domain